MTTHGIAAPAEARAPRSAAGAAAVVERIGRHAVRYGLVAVITWIGAMKFTAYEANAIKGLVENSPLMAWTYGALSVRGLGVMLGLTELGIALCIAVGPASRSLGVIGAAGAIGMFATTLSFIASTPGVFEQSIGGFPALSVMPGQFLVKDLALLGAAIWLLGESLRSVSDRSPSRGG